MTLMLRDEPSLELGWGGVGHVNVRWNLHMTLMLRDEPSLENQIDLLSATGKALQNL